MCFEGRMNFPPRKQLPHEVPSWVETGAVFFVTICAAERRVNSLCLPGVGDGLIAAAQAYHERAICHARLVVLMPDHLHALVAVPRDRALKTVVTQWKSYTAKTLGVRWQRDFFDHRPARRRVVGGEGNICAAESGAGGLGGVRGGLAVAVGGRRGRARRSRPYLLTLPRG